MFSQSNVSENFLNKYEIEIPQCKSQQRLRDRFRPYDFIASTRVLANIYHTVYQDWFNNTFSAAGFLTFFFLVGLL